MSKETPRKHVNMREIVGPLTSRPLRTEYLRAVAEMSKFETNDDWVKHAADVTFEKTEQALKELRQNR